MTDNSNKPKRKSGGLTGRGKKGPQRRKKRDDDDVPTRGRPRGSVGDKRSSLTDKNEEPRAKKARASRSNLSAPQMPDRQSWGSYGPNPSDAGWNSKTARPPSKSPGPVKHDNPSDLAALIGGAKNDILRGRGEDMEDEEEQNDEDANADPYSTSAVFL